MKSQSLPSHYRQFPLWTKLAAAGLVTIAIAGCGGGDSTPATTTTTTVATTTTTTLGGLTPLPAPVANAVVVSSVSASAFSALVPKIDPASVKVTINSPPVVTFKVVDGAGNPVVGLGSKGALGTTSTSSTVATLANMSFTLAKLVPGANGSPSKWVNYVMFRPPTKGELLASTRPANSACDVAVTADNPTWCGTYPAADSQGTLVDVGDGNYQYTFYRDIKQAAAIVATLNDSADGLSKKADAGDLSYDATLTHRLGIMITGNQPGTTTVPLINHLNLAVDFVPAGGTPTVTRDVVVKDSCSECHDGKGIGHYRAQSVVPGGALKSYSVGRNDPRLCVTCHTDQIKFSFNAGEAPMASDGITFAGYTSADVSNSQKRSRFAIVNGRSEGNFPNMIHKMHMHSSFAGTDLTKKGYNFNNAGEGEFNAKNFPQNPGNCVKCHDGSANAAHKTTNGDNWKTVPSALACGACHDGINFATGKGTAMGASGKVVGGHVGGAQANDAVCALCHTADNIGANHTDNMSTTTNAAKRTMSATITGVTVDANGGVTAKFTVSDAGAAVTDGSKFKVTEMTLAKLVAGVSGAPSHWVSYTSRFRTKDANMAPVLQGYSESTGTVTANADGSFSYKFALKNGSTEGDIRTVDHAHNVSTVAPYAGTAWTGAGATVAGTGVNVVAYDPTLTHRVGMIFQKVGSPNVDNATNAFYDFVPAGGAVTATRNIVSMDNCATCHGGVKLHKAYKTELCVVCHNNSTYDPFPTAGTAATRGNVDLAKLVHKVHSRGGSVAVSDYLVNDVTFVSAEPAYPGIIHDCVVCHKEGSGAPANAANWKTVPNAEACGACHDNSTATLHIAQNSSLGQQSCTLCHAPGKLADSAVMHKVVR